MKKYSKKSCKIHKRTLVLESLLHKVVGLEACNFIKIDTLTHAFSCEIYNLSRHLFHKTPPEDCF